jgi:hypothetical protein
MCIFAFYKCLNINIITKYFSLKKHKQEITLVKVIQHSTTYIYTCLSPSLSISIHPHLILTVFILAVRYHGNILNRWGYFTDKRNTRAPRTLLCSSHKKKFWCEESKLSNINTLKWTISRQQYSVSKIN